MATVKGRRKRVGAAGSVQLNVRVHQDRKRKAEQIADALGVTLNAYFDSLLAREQLDEAGRPLWWPEQEVPSPGQGELPLAHAS